MCPVISFPVRKKRQKIEGMRRERKWNEERESGMAKFSVGRTVSSHA